MCRCELLAGWMEMKVKPLDSTWKDSAAAWLGLNLPLLWTNLFKIQHFYICFSVELCAVCVKCCHCKKKKTDNISAAGGHCSLSQQIKNAWRTLWNPVKDTVDGQGLCHCADNGFTLCSGSFSLIKQRGAQKLIQSHSSLFSRFQAWLLDDFGGPAAWHHKRHNNVHCQTEPGQRMGIWRERAEEATEITNHPYIN